MGIGPEAVELYRLLRDNGNLQEVNSVIEIGSQEIPTAESHQNYARTFVSSITEKAPKSNPLTTQEFYEALGISDYACIDVNGENDALVYDLNTDIMQNYGIEKTYDLVTNFGTTEHIFNQYQCFKNMHDLLKVGGLAIHILPFEGYLNHGYFNYQPAFFIDLGLANSYELVGIYYSAEMRGFRNIIPIPYTDDLPLVLHELCLAGKFSHTPHNNTSSLEVVYRKTLAAPFQLPFDARFSDINKLHNNYVAISMPQRDNVSNNAMYKDIEKYMAGRGLLYRWREVHADPKVMIRMLRNFPKFLKRKLKNFLFQKFMIGEYE